MEFIARSAMAVAQELRRAMRGRVVLPGDEGYGAARQLWNGAVNRRPALFAMCESADDVRAAVRTAQAHGLPLSVRGGGHDWAGRALRENGMVIDLSAMRRVEVDPATHTARVAGGARASDVIAAAAPHGLVAVTGTVGSVGMAGLLLGGGYGPLSSRFGLALDNLLGADLVLADGRKVSVDDLEYPDLCWALRGGGGNFGVVTSMQIRLHPLAELLSGLILFAWSEAASVLRRYAEAVAGAPDELDVLAGMVSGPDGRPHLFLAPTWTGEAAPGARIMDELQRLGSPVSAHLQTLRYDALLHRFDAQVVPGRHYAVQTRWLAALTPAAIAALVEAGSDRTSALSAIAIHRFHGAAARVPLRATAFGLRREHFLVEIIAAWEPATGDSALHRQWARRLSETLAPLALPGGYPNMLGPADLDQAAQAYGRNLAELQEVKRLFDPEGLFAATPLPAAEFTS